VNYSIFNKSESDSELIDYSDDVSEDKINKDIMEDNTASLLKKRKRRGMKIKRGINCSWTIEEVNSYKI
jgi:hypothetical protein